MRGWIRAAMPALGRSKRPAFVSKLLARRKCARSSKRRQALPMAPKRQWPEAATPWRPVAVR